MARERERERRWMDRMGLMLRGGKVGWSGVGADAENYSPSSRYRAKQARETRCWAVAGSFAGREWRQVVVVAECNKPPQRSPMMLVASF